MSALIILSLFACKKKDAEAAAEAGPNPAKAVTVRIAAEGVQHARVTCKDTGFDRQAKVEGGVAVVPNINGEDCRLFIMPGGYSWGPVKAGSDVQCTLKDNELSCV